ncbi:MAG: hypothetical protein KAH32_06935 [Chlamydiia bacterium]|nr:hypothetical protein [Chlamydiia bacterium]
MSRVIFCPKSMGSESAKELAKFFKTKKVFKNKRFRRRASDLLINWGNASEIPVFNELGLNDPSRVAISSNKVLTFNTLSDANVNIPNYALNKNDAEELFEQEGIESVFCRTLTRASEGRGIVIASNRDQLVHAGLYTVSQPHTNEYRVHIFDGRVIDIAEKRKLSEERLAELEIEFNPNIKSHNNGWIFARGNARLKHLDGQMKTDLAVQSLAAVEAIGLTFGAVDIIYNNPTRTAYVLEVNSAPGMEAGSTTLHSYVNAISIAQSGEAITLDTFNAEYPEIENLTEYPLVTEFINNI